jgi:hypothetical protein
MIKVRDGFETNSSSSHSVVISGTDNVFSDFAMLGILDGDTLHIDGETNFGWEWEIWSMPGDKINYIIIDSDDEAVTERIVELIKEKTGAKHVEFTSLDAAKKEGSYNAYVDHQSIGTSAEVRGLDNESLWKFIMNPESSFRGGNDNSDGPWSTYDDEDDD